LNLAILATVFPLIFVGELPDKTMFASLLLSTRGRPGAVWLGAAGAFTVHMAIAVTAGTAAVLLLPHRVLEAAVAVMFAAGVVLVIREIRHGRADGDGGEPAPPGPPASAGHTALTSFVVVFVAEWGDLTQVLTANLAAHYRAPVTVGVGAVLALWAVSALAVTSGRWLTRFMDATLLRTITAVVLAAFAAYTGWVAVN
jgi:putative Ca2+/H+ antiporter (TMEM165/GDT1 family)